MSRPFANLDGLVRLSHKEGVDVRRPLLRVLTDLYVQEANHTREEEQQYVELALRLLPDVDATTRTVVARKLKAYGQAPAAVLDAIRHSTPEVAPLLATQDPSDKTSLAGDARRISSEGTISRLAQAGDNASERSDAASPLASMPPDPGDAFLRMTAAERSALLESLYRPNTMEPAEDYGPAPRPGARKRLERAALTRNHHEFARELQLSLGITARVASRIAHDDSGELIIVAAKALDMRIEMLTRVLLIMNPSIGHSIERVFTLCWLYQRLLPETVMPIVAGWRDDVAARGTARFRSIHADDEAAEGVRPRDAGRSLRDDQSRVRRTGGETPLRRQDAS